MPHLRTVLASIERKIRFSTRRPIMITVKRSAKTEGNLKPIPSLVDEPAETALAA